jgi:hypothetical protein
MKNVAKKCYERRLCDRYCGAAICEVQASISSVPAQFEGFSGSSASSYLNEQSLGLAKSTAFTKSRPVEALEHCAKYLLSHPIGDRRLIYGRLQLAVNFAGTARHSIECGIGTPPLKNGAGLGPPIDNREHRHNPFGSKYPLFCAFSPPLTGICDLRRRVC